MKKQATEEQKTKTKERRERFRGIVKTIAKMSDVERFELSKRVSILSCEGKSYSLCNTMLLALQCPTATVMGGFRQWKKEGRNVCKGEHGHMIWVPMVYGEVPEGTPQPSEIDGEEKKTGVRFLVGTVFDVSQTEEISQGTESEAA